MAQVQGERWDIVVDGEEFGSADINRRPTSDLVDEIANHYFRTTSSSEPFRVVNWLISKMCTGFSGVKGPDGQELRFPADIGKMPPAARNALYAECYSVVEPLIPNLGRTGN